MKIPFSQGQGGSQYRFGHKLFDLEADPGQEHPVDNPEKEIELIEKMARLMKENDAPVEQYQRVGIPADGKLTREKLLEQRRQDRKQRIPEALAYLGEWQEEAAWAYKALIWNVGEEGMEHKLREFLEKRSEGRKNLAETQKIITKSDIVAFAKTVAAKEDWEMVLYTMETMSRLS